MLSLFPHDRRHPGHTGSVVWACVFVLSGVCLMWGGTESRGKPGPTTPGITPLRPALPEVLTRNANRARAIQDVQVGDRVMGSNPVRKQAEEIEPDPATWRKISLHIRKESGLSLWIDLLRPLAWLETNGVEQGRSFFLRMPEMGAIGDAEVNYVGPCPSIKAGKGAVVTGKFTHQADANSNVVLLRLEGQTEATGVTDNHPYWSEDRKRYVEVGRLQIGEHVNTLFGLRRVESVMPRSDRGGLLYNIETTEHVYRVGSLGTLVHNDCLDYAKTVLRRRPGGAIIQMKPLDAPQTGPLPGYPVAGPHGMREARSAAEHYFHLENGILRDPAHTRGIPIDDWINELARLNNFKPSELLDLYNFLPYIP